MKNIFNLSYLSKVQLKQFRFFMLYLLAVVALTSCEDALLEEPKTIAAELFYNTPSEVETAVNAIYNPIRSSRAEQIAILDAHTDWGYGRGSRAQYNDFAGFNANNINNAGLRWNSFYLSIRNANLVIKNAPEGTAISQEDIDKYVAEAKFLRALCYFDLVRNWSGVPLRTEDNLEQIDLERSSVDEVYELIISDLTEAEAVLGDLPYQIGRPTTWAAKTLLADVYLFRGRYQDARDKAEEVIQSSKFSLVPVSSVEDLRWDLFGPEITTTPEEIFYLKYAREMSQGNYLLWILNHPSTGLYNFGGAYAHYSLSDNPFMVNWDDNDLRKGLWDPAEFGLGPNTLVSGKYTDPAAVDNSGAGNDLPIYRYAEVLLIFAEADARVANEPTVDAMEALNKVHRRAYGEDPTNASAIDFKIEDYNFDTFIDLVLQERAYEFIFEGKRWLTLKRTGNAQEAIMAAKGITIAEAHYLWPIPVNEMDFNKALDPAVDQNPGY